MFNLLLNEFDVKNYERCIRAEGRIEGKIEGKAEAIIELLEDVGELPDSLIHIIREQTDLETLGKWHKIAAKAQSIEDFITTIYQLH